MNLSEAEQQTFAAELADALIEDKLPLNGLGEAEKAFKYFVATQNRASLGQMVDVRREPNTPFHQTKNTPQYYQIVSDVLVGFVKDNPDLSDKDLLHIFGWAIRLAKYRYATRSGSLSLRTNHRTPYSEAPRRERQTDQQLSRQTSQNNKRRASADRNPKIGDVVTGQIIHLDRDGIAEVRLNHLSDSFVGILRKSDAKGRRSGGIRGEVIQIDKKDSKVYLLLKPVKRAKE